MYGINILICTTDFKTLCIIHQDIQDQAYTIPALLWVHSLMKHHNSETFQELTLQECIDLVVLLMCSDKSFLISQTICDAHLLHMYVPGPLNESAKVGKQCVWSYSRSLTCELQSSDSGFTIEFHRMHTLQNLLIYFNILVINTWKQLKKCLTSPIMSTRNLRAFSSWTRLSVKICPMYFLQKKVTSYWNARCSFNTLFLASQF